MRFRLIAGKYDHDGKTYEQGSVVESDKDLAAKFGVKKFQRLDAGERPRATTKQGTAVTDLERFDSDEEDGGEAQDPNMEGEEVEGEESEEETVADAGDLNDMTIEELKTFAAGDEIDLEGASRKADIIKQIKKTLKARK